ncbi:MAG: 4-hydroxy-tetrahydrodipicolinate synthase [Lachnospiraceae bacterium]|nr:4-hydroxy-tetrahydrodipicolinate synthase [Lachnospiraceae bacterium]
MAIFKGAGVAIITPMHEDGSLNFDEFEKLIENQIKGGTDAIIVCGSTGEPSTLSEEEHLQMIRFCVEKVNHRIPVVAGTGSNATRTAIELSTEAEKAGADGLLVVAPYYNKATQNGLYEHFKAIAESVKTPIILYNVPSRTCCNIQPETAARLCKDIPNIVGIKEASGDLSQIAKLMYLADGNIDLYSGNDEQTLPIMSLGGIGVISVLSNVAPRQTHEMCMKFLEGDLAGAAKIQVGAVELIDALFCEVNPIPVKKAVEFLGYQTKYLRRPLTEMEPAHQERLKKAMKEFGLL